MSPNKDTNFFLTEEVKDSCNPKLKLKDKVKFLCLINKISLSQLSDMVGVSKSTISHIVNHDWTPSSLLKLKIAEALQVDSLVIWGDEQYFTDYQKGIQQVKENENENN